jgi:hypothetical protein
MLHSFPNFQIYLRQLSHTLLYSIFKSAHFQIFKFRNMYANLDNPPSPAVAGTTTGIDTDRHLTRLGCIAGLLALIARAHERMAYSRLQYDSYSLGSSPFVTRSRWQDDLQKWSYIAHRLERYYLKKVCALNSDVYRAISEV